MMQWGASFSDHYWNILKLSLKTTAKIGIPIKTPSARDQRENRFVYCAFLHTEKYFRNLVKSTWNHIVFTIFRLIWNQAQVRLVSNQSVHGKYNLIWDRFNKIWWARVGKSTDFGASVSVAFQHTENYFPNRIKSNPNQIVFTMHL